MYLQVMPTDNYIQEATIGTPFWVLIFFTLFSLGAFLASRLIKKEKK